MTSLSLQSNKIYRITAPLIILLLPFVAMQFTNRVIWSLFDFIVAGLLVLGASLAYELIATNVKDSTYRIILSTALLLVLLFIWAELAVGIFHISGISGN